MKYVEPQLYRNFAFTELVDRMVIQARKGTAAMRIMATENYEQRHLVLRNQRLVLSAIEYALAFLTSKWGDWKGYTMRQCVSY